MNPLMVEIPSLVVSTAREVMPGTDQHMPLWRLLWRTNVAAVAPHKVFRQIRDGECPYWPHVLVVVVLGNIFDFFFHGYLFFKWVNHLPALEVIALAFANVCYSLDQWLFCLLALLGLNRWNGSPVKHASTLGVASFYVIMSRGILTYTVGLLQFFSGVPSLVVDFSRMGWRFQPIFGHVVPLASLIGMVWISFSLWLLLRHLLRFSAPHQLLVAFVLAIVVPLGGRLSVASLPTLTFYILSRQVGWHPSPPLVILGSLALANVVGVVAISWWLRKPLTAFQ